MAGMGSFDFSELTALGERLRRAQTDGMIDRMLESAIRELALRLLRKIKLLTPVDTGLLRNSWTVGPVQRSGNLWTIEVYTDIEYAEWVEFGHRYGVNLTKWKGGTYMMTLSVKELEEQLPAILERKQQEMLKRLLGG